MGDNLTSSLNLLRRLPPSAAVNSLAGLIELVPELTEELLSAVDQPLQVATDGKTGRPFLLSDYNRDGDSYRSPWSNEYFPPMADGFMPSAKLRALEVQANSLFDAYRKLYFEGGVSSVYFFDTDDGKSEGFGCTFLIHKDVTKTLKKDKSLKKGFWDSIHVFEVSPDAKRGYFRYKLTTTVMVSMGLNDPKIGEVDLSGSMTQQSTKTRIVDKDNLHIGNLGPMLEDMELKIRNAIEGIYIQKTREVVNGMRSTDAAKQKAWQGIAESLNRAVITHGSKRVKDSDI